LEGAKFKKHFRLPQKFKEIFGKWLDLALLFYHDVIKNRTDNFIAINLEQ